MKCAFCQREDTQVIDSRSSKSETCIRRRRECKYCRKRFTTYERLEDKTIYVLKKDGRREPFALEKISEGLKIALNKRPINHQTSERIALSVQKKVKAKYSKEVPSIKIGEYVLDELKKIDNVAYVRFASVYKEFKDVTQFIHEIKSVKGNSKK